jgi:CPA1 family monovalent cation:H+ antiporter
MVLVLLLAVVVSSIVGRLLRGKLPLPVIQIGIGVALSYLSRFNVRLDPNIFLPLFIAPLLFLDGWRIPKNVLVNEWRSIVTLALGLVVFTVIGVGFLISAMIPAMPLAVAFATAAILAPTDPIAVSAISGNAPIPARLMHILEGEALFNDASGLISFRFAVAAAITGSFSLADASLTFLKVAAGGLITGIVIALGASAIYHKLVRWIGDEPGTPILISILIPFAAYLAAEHLGLSGIFAAVAAGISIHYANLIGRETAVIRMRRTAIWDMLQVALNGIIFVLLGLQLRTIIESVPNIARQIPGGNAVWLVGYVFAITLGLAALRFIWVWASLEGSRVLAALRGEQREQPSARFLLVSALAGVKGAVTLAGILTLPFLMPDGTPFPARDLAIFLAMGVILLSLLAASIGLPLLTKNLQVADSLRPSNEEQNARNAAVEAAIQRLEEIQEQGDENSTEIDSEAASRVIEHYRSRLDRQDSSDDGGQSIRDAARAERRFRVIALRAERSELYRMRRAGEIDDSIHHRLVREIDLSEESLSHSA